MQSSKNIENETILSQIASLKAMKGCPKNSSFVTELIRTTGYVNIVDMLLLPLYYTWEYKSFGELKEVHFEPYLEKAYQRFCCSAKRYTRKIINILQKISNKKEISQNVQLLVNSLIRLYSIIVITI